MDRKLIGAGVVVALLAGGCGSSSKPLTQADFTQRANAICRRVNAKVDRQVIAMMQAIKRHDRAAALQVANKAGQAEDAGLKELNALKPPKAMQARYAHYMELENTLRQINHRLRKTHRPASAAYHAHISQMSHEGANLRENLGLSNCNRY